MSNEVFGFAMHIKVVFTLCYSLLNVQLCLFKNVWNLMLKYFIAKKCSPSSELPTTHNLLQSEGGTSMQMMPNDQSGGC